MNNPTTIATKKDYRLDWFSGTGAGGQHRNKHQNCLRLTHIPSGITVTAQTERDRQSNLKKAVKIMAIRLKAYYHPEIQKQRIRATEEVRVYHEPDNRVKDHASGLRQTFKEVVKDGNLDQMIEARKLAVEKE